MTRWKLGQACKLRSRGEEALYFIEGLSECKKADGTVVPSFTLATQFRNRIFTTLEEPVPLSKDGRMLKWTR